MENSLRSGQPRHEQISSWLRKHIKQRAFTADEKLPSENEMSKEFDVSRVTVRHALRTLEAEGLIYRRQGLGSFVKSRPVAQCLNRVTDFMEDMAAAGIEGSSEVVFFGPDMPTSEIGNLLGVSEGVPVIRVDRVRRGAGQPVAFDSTWLPLLYGQFLDQHDLAVSSISEILEASYQIPVQRGRYRIEAGAADSRTAHHLHVNQQDPVLIIGRLVYTSGDKPLFFQRRYYRSDKVAYCLDLQRAPEDSGSDSVQLRDFEPEFKQ